MRDGLIAMFLYQNEDVLRFSRARLKRVNRDPEVRFRVFSPYFDASLFPFVDDRPDDVFGLGRISRQDPDKFSRETIRIYEGVTSSVVKRGLFVGFSNEVCEKTGWPPDWIRIAGVHGNWNQQDFYRFCDVVLQPSDTLENWPRVGFEAMASGSVLIVDNRGGWRRMVEHGKTGWLCNSPDDFIQYASLMAQDPRLKREMACAARQRGQDLGGFDHARQSWSEIFSEISQLPD